MANSFGTVNRLTTLLIVVTSAAVAFAVWLPQWRYRPRARPAAPTSRAFSTLSSRMTGTPMTRP